jgi:hypothetical protein
MNKRDVTICDSCQRLDFDLAMTPVCDAFPNGIPEEIFVSGFDHRSAFPGDNDIRYLLDEGRAPALREYEKQVAEGHLRPPDPTAREDERADPNVDRSSATQRFAESGASTWHDQKGEVIFDG